MEEGPNFGREVGGVSSVLTVQCNFGKDIGGCLNWGAVPRRSDIVGRARWAKFS
jgi:hypothetical protein